VTSNKCCVSFIDGDWADENKFKRFASADVLSVSISSLWKYVIIIIKTFIAHLLLKLQGGPAKVRPTYIFDGNI